jgi:hypothetical protein
MSKTIEPFSKGEMVVLTHPKDESTYIIKKIDYGALTNEVDKLIKGEELLAGGIGFLLGIWGATLVFAFYPFSGGRLITSDPWPYEFFFSVAYLSLIGLYYLLYAKRKEQGDTVKQNLRSMVSAKYKNP